MSSRTTPWLAAVLVAAVLFADAAPLEAGQYTWSGFVNYWRNYASSGSRVIQVTCLVMAGALLIITRGKWQK